MSRTAYDYYGVAETMSLPPTALLHFEAGGGHRFYPRNSDRRDHPRKHGALLEIRT
jgi:hypothetical protein